MADLIPFRFDTSDIRIHMDDTGTPWWVLKDVCDTLGIQNVSDTANRLSPLESTILDFSYDGIPHRLLLVNESGLYRIIFRSNKPEARRFQDWVFGEVLPQIRKTGKYDVRQRSPQLAPPQEQLDVLQSCVQALKALGCFDDRDVISFGAYYRRIAASASGEGPEHGAQQDATQPVLWTMSMRLQFLKYPPLTGKEGEGQQIKIGSRAAKLHASTYGEGPKKLWDYVKGQQRHVNGYLPERVEVLDQAIFSVLGAPRFQVLPGKE